MSKLNQKSSWWLTVAKWQDQRWLWILGGLIAVALELIAVFYFQEHLGQRPCEMCVYIRFAMIAMALFAFITAIYPKNIILKLIGYIGVFWAIIRGFLWSLNLEMITLDRLRPDYNPFTSSCSINEASFPLGLPMHKWFPSHFMQTGICGEDTWSLWGLNMAEYMMIIYGIFALVLGIMMVCWLSRLFLKKA